MAKVESWYLKQDGTYADPGNCSRGKDGVLREKDSGLLIAMTADGEPITVASGAEMNKNVEAAKLREAPALGPRPGPAPVPPAALGEAKPATAEEAAAATAKK